MRTSRTTDTHTKLDNVLPVISANTNNMTYNSHTDLAPRTELMHYLGDLTMHLTHITTNQWWPFLSICLYHQTPRRSSYRHTPSGHRRYVLIPQERRALTIP